MDQHAEAPSQTSAEALRITEASRALRERVGELGEPLATVVGKRYGLFCGGREYRLWELAGELGVSKERVRKLEPFGLRRLSEGHSHRQKEGVERDVSPS